MGWDGSVEGFPVGISDGPELGCTDGLLETDGCWEGWREGFVLKLGPNEGCCDGIPDIEGWADGYSDGNIDVDGF